MDLIGLQEWRTRLKERKLQLSHQLSEQRAETVNFPKGSCPHRTLNQRSRTKRELRVTRQTILELSREIKLRKKFAEEGRMQNEVI
jgi:hypothetical protein